MLGCVTVEGVRDHLEEFQKIADNSDDPVYPGTRAAGTDGYADSVEYVANLLEDAGYEVTLDPVFITFNFPAVLRQLTPAPAVDHETGVFTGSGNGTVQGNVIPVDINLTGDRASTSGCSEADFAGLNFDGPNDIALVQRGTCFFGTKAFYAEQAGAEAVIIFNQGNTPDREALVVADATSVDPPIPGNPGPVMHGIPVVGASFADGVALARSARVVLQRLAAEAGETAALAVVRGGALTYVAEATADTVVTAGWQGREVAVHATSTGKVLLAFSHPAEIRALLRLPHGQRLPRYTPSTITALSTLEKELALTRERGYAVCRGEFETSAWGVSAPVLDLAGRPVAIVSVWGP
ncbi:MAG TPA: IclR family transcriptional regulator C-terminal domain-containing protein, partial [Propionibacteriaceae bacterium]|nr:IclR family transcriptional regulator C-terminal domain-containing protein [Propionibacteriaceae bacterium]